MTQRTSEGEQARVWEKRNDVLPPLTGGARGPLASEHEGEERELGWGDVAAACGLGSLAS